MINYIGGSIEMKSFVHEELSNKLLNSLNSRITIPPLTETNPDLTVEDAYEIQLINVKKLLDDGEIISGKKIGLTSKGMQELLNITEPDYGHLFKSMEVPNGGSISIKKVIRPKVEGEVAFVLKEDLIGPNITLEDVYRATEYICASIEVVDSRIHDWKIKLVDTIADNGSSALYILGDKKVPIDSLDLSSVEMRLYKNDQLLNSGKGEEVLGNPANGVVWLANKLYEFGVVLRKGEVILSGAFTASPEAYVGDRFTCDFGELGEVNVEFR